MGKDRQCGTVGLRKGPWSAAEDELLTNYIQAHGEGQWSSLPIKAGLQRCGKSCRLRWMNYLRPGINKGNFAADEDDLIIRLHRLLGNRWSLIAGRIPGRTDNQIKNYWNSHLSKKVNSIQEVGIDSTNHCIYIPQGKKHCSSNHDHNEDDVNGKKKLTDCCKKNVHQEGEKVEVFSPKPVRVSSATVTSDACNNSNGSDHDIGNSTRGSRETFGFTDAAWLNSLLGTDEEMMETCLTDNLGDQRSLEEVYEEYLRLLKTDGENVFDGAQLNY